MDELKNIILLYETGQKDLADTLIDSGVIPSLLENTSVDLETVLDMYFLGLAKLGDALLPTVKNFESLTSQDFWRNYLDDKRINPTISDKPIGGRMRAPSFKIYFGEYTIGIAKYFAGMPFLGLNIYADIPSTLTPHNKWKDGANCPYLSNVVDNCKTLAAAFELVLRKHQLND